MELFYEIVFRSGVLDEISLTGFYLLREHVEDEPIYSKT